MERLKIEHRVGRELMIVKMFVFLHFVCAVNVNYHLKMHFKISKLSSRTIYYIISKVE